jgi:thiamine kinase-like enzyme
MKKLIMKLFQKKIIIPEIESKINERLDFLGLIPKTSPERFIKERGLKKHRYFTLCKDSDGLSFFYARIHNNQDAKDKFISEINFLKQINNDFIPKIKNWGIEKNFEWFLRESIEFETLSEFKIKEIEDLSLKMAELMIEVSNIEIDTSFLKKFNYNQYLNIKLLKKISEKKIITDNLAEEIRLMIKRSINLIAKDSFVISHGDLTLENIMSDKKKLWIIDWERVHLNSFVYDTCFLWMHLWDNDSARKNFIKFYFDKTNKKDLFIKIFPIICCYLASGGVVFEDDKLTSEKNIKRRKFCNQVLINSVKGFEKLIET